MSYDIATPYTAAYIIFRKGNKVAFLLRENVDWMSGHYGLVAGRVEKDEPFTSAAVREAQEEVGVTIDPKDLVYLMTAHRKTPEHIWVDVFFEAKKYTGELHNAEPKVHSKLEWFDPNDLPDNVIPVLRYYLQQIEAGNTYCEYGWAE